jgi:hypothetical protein
MLGDASAAMTLDIYADLFDDDLDAVAVALNNAVLPAGVGKMWAGQQIARKARISLQLQGNTGLRLGGR